MVFTLLIAAFAVILLGLVMFVVLGAIGRAATRARAAPDPTIADSRDGFDPN